MRTPRLRQNAVGSKFQGFTIESFAFFQELARNNNKAWFDANHDRYELHVRETFRSLLAGLEPFLLELNPHFEVSGITNRNFSRINRDIRFSRDKRPYKPNYYLYVYDGRRERATDGRFYVGLSAECVTVGFAIYATWGRGPKGALETVFRPRVQKEGELFRRLVDSVVRRKRFETYWYRQERGDWVLHPGVPKKREDWTTLQGWVVRRVFAAGAPGLATPDFAHQAANIFGELYPLYAFTSDSSPRWKARLRT